MVVGRGAVDVPVDCVRSLARVSRAAGSVMMRGKR